MRPNRQAKYQDAAPPNKPISRLLVESVLRYKLLWYNLSLFIKILLQDFLWMPERGLYWFAHIYCLFLYVKFYDIIYKLCIEKD